MSNMDDTSFSQLLSDSLAGNAVAQAKIEKILWGKIPSNHFNIMIEMVQNTLKNQPKNAVANHILASVHFFGIGGVTVDHAMAIFYYKNAIAEGYAPSMYMRAHMHKHGYGEPSNYVLATKLLTSAMALNYPLAMNALGDLHVRGINGPINYPAAIALFERAIALDLSEAMNFRAYLHQYGLGGPVDYTAAIVLYERAIALDFPDAMKRRAMMHEYGQGGPTDYERAADLYEQYYSHGDDTDKKNALSHLIKLAQNDSAVKANYYLCNMHLYGNKNIVINHKMAFMYFNRHAQRITQLIFNDIIKLINQPDFAENTLETLINLTTEHLQADQLHFIQYKLFLKSDPDRALDYYKNNPGIEEFFTGQDYFLLGSHQAAQYNPKLHSKDEQISYITKACKLLYKGYEVGHESCITLFKRYVVTLESLQTGNLDPLQLPNDDIIHAIIQKFKANLRYEKKHINLAHITALKAFIYTETTKQSKRHSFKFFPAPTDNVAMAEVILTSLQKNIPLSDILEKECMRLNTKPCKKLNNFLQRFLLNSIEQKQAPQLRG